MRFYFQRLRHVLCGAFCGGFALLVMSLAATPAFAASAAAPAPPLQIAAAADLANCIADLNAAFIRQAGPADIRFSVGSSGNFFAQIRSGAPFDLFLSADMFYPQALVKAGLADPASLVVYAHGRLMLWSANPDIDVSKGLGMLSDPRVARIAIANPDIAPYGRAAKAALERAGLWERLKPKLVYGENVAQAAQFIQTGNAQAGFVGSAHVSGGRAGAGRVWPLPADTYPLMEQGAIVTTHGRTNPAARAYLDFLVSDAGRAVLLRYGFSLPDARR